MFEELAIIIAIRFFFADLYDLVGIPYWFILIQWVVWPVALLLNMLDFYLVPCEVLVVVIQLRDWIFTYVRLCS